MLAERSAGSDPGNRQNETRGQPTGQTTEGAGRMKQADVAGAMVGAARA